MREVSASHTECDRCDRRNIDKSMQERRKRPADWHQRGQHRCTADPEKVCGGQHAEKGTIRCPGKSRMGKDVACREAAVGIELAKAC